MSDKSGTRNPSSVVVKPFIDREIFFSSSRACAVLHSLWPILRASAVDTVQSSFEDIAAFQENCLYFATIIYSEWKQPSDLLDISVPPTSPTPEMVEGSNREEDRLNFQSDPWPLGTISRSDYLSAWRDRSIPSQWDSQPSSNFTRNFMSDHIFEPKAPESESTVGVIYLMQSNQNSTSIAEINLGLALIPGAQDKGIGGKAVLEVLKWVFDEMKLHRVQVGIMDSPSKHHALNMFLKLGFTFEGERRSAILDPIYDTWKTATFLSLLDTDWTLRDFHPHLTRWDEMLGRHQKEREELLRWENAHPPKQIHKSASAETLRLTKDNSGPEGLPESIADISGAHDKGKQKETSTWTDYHVESNEVPSPTSVTSSTADTESWYNSDFEPGRQVDPSSSSSHERLLDQNLAGIPAPPPDSESDGETDASWVSSTMGRPDSRRVVPLRARSSAEDSDWDVLDP